MCPESARPIQPRHRHQTTIRRIRQDPWRRQRRQHRRDDPSPFYRGRHERRNNVQRNWNCEEFIHSSNRDPAWRYAIKGPPTLAETQSRPTRQRRCSSPLHTDRTRRNSTAPVFKPTCTPTWPVQPATPGSRNHDVMHHKTPNIPAAQSNPDLHRITLDDEARHSQLMSVPGRATRRQPLPTQTWCNRTVESVRRGT